jgi:hypothetical protein
MYGNIPKTQLASHADTTKIFVSLLVRFGFLGTKINGKLPTVNVMHALSNKGKKSDDMP